MKILRNLLIFVLVAVMIFSFTACAGAEVAAGDYHSKEQVNAMIDELEIALTKLIDENKAAIVALEQDYIEKTTTLEVQSSENAAAIAALKEEYEEKVAELESEIAALESAKGGESEDYSEKIAALEAADAANAKAIADLTAAYNAKVKAIDDAIAVANKAIADNKAAADAKIAELEADIAALEDAKTEAGTDYSEEIAALEAEITALEARVAALEAEEDQVGADYSEEIAALEAEITAANKKIADNKSEYDAKVKAIDEAITAANKAITDNKTATDAEITALKARVAELEMGKDTAGVDYSAKIAELESATAANAQAIAANKAAYDAKVKAIDEAITAANKAITDNKTACEGAVKALESDIEANAAEIAKMKNDYDAKLDALEKNAAELLGIDATLSEAGKAADAKAVGEAVDKINSTLVRITELLEPVPIYEYVYVDVDITSEEAQARKNHYLAPSGTPSTSETYSYTEKFEVLPGDVIGMTSYNPDQPTNTQNYVQNLSMRMVTVYDKDGKVLSALGISPGGSTSEFTIPDGVAYVAVTYHNSQYKNGMVPVFERYTQGDEFNYIISDSANSKTVLEAVKNINAIQTEMNTLKASIASLDVAKIQALSANIEALNAKIDALDVDKLNESIENIKNLDTNQLNILVSSVLGSPSILAKADMLNDGAEIKLEHNTLLNNKRLVFGCKIGESGFGDGILRLGHGKTGYGSNYIEVTKTQVILYSHASATSELARWDHGLDIKGYLNVTISVEYSHWATITLSTASGTWSGQKNWSGRAGEIFAEVSGATELTDVTMRWYSNEYEKTIWMVGDSYFSSTSGDRWTSYLIKGGYKDVLLMSHSGMASARGYSEVVQALEHGTPKYIVWCMGMNNGDSTNGTINASYLENTQKFLALCEEKGITPILTTIPSTPIVYNEVKNEWVRNWAATTGGRYIDFSRAVSNETYDESLKGKPAANTSGESTKNNTTGYQWYDGMLHSDAVHPATKGAEALYYQALIDFPELMGTNTK